ncbi:MAG: amino acid synthesis family protein [Rhizobiaceae bacterium]
MTDQANLIRKIYIIDETTFVEAHKAAEKPLRFLAAAAVIKNPWPTDRFVEDLRPQILRVAPVLGVRLTQEITSRISGSEVEGYGKAAVVGTAGEVEHASALIHTLRFGNFYRTAVEAKSYLSFTNTRGGPNTAIMIPLMHKHDEGMRSHYLTIQFSIPDAPAPDEIVVALGASVGGRPHHRIGDRYKDLEELKQEQH